MKKQGLRIFAYFAVVLMLVSILPAGALAASDNGQNSDNGMSEDNGRDNSNADDNSADNSDNTEEDNEPPGIQQHDRDRDMVNANEDATREMAANKEINKAEHIKESKAGYQSAKNNFASIKSKNPNLDTEEAIEATKEYLVGSIDYMTSLLEDDEYITELEDERENVEAATTRQELADSAKNIRNIWNDARKDRVMSAGKTIDNKINAVVKTSESLIVRLENEIATMKENGEDVEDLEAMLEEYKEYIADAKENQEQARNTYMNGNGNYGENVREANRYVAQAGKDIRDSNAILRNMLQELKEQREGVIVLSGEGTLEATGNGTVVISGDVVIDLTVTDAKLVVKDLAGDAVINVDDAEYETSNIDSGNSTDNNRAFVYHNITGDVTIEGSRLTVMIRGDDIDLTAEGTGTAVLAGTGSYTVDGESGDWANRYVDDSSENEDESENEIEEETGDEVETAGDDGTEEESDESSEEDTSEEESTSENEEEDTSGDDVEDENETTV